MTTATAARPQPATGTASWMVPLVVLIFGMFMSVLDTSIVNVAIPTIQKDFGAATDDIQWIATAYTLALGVIVPLSGWLGDRVGMTRVYLVCLVAFAGASALCGLAWNLNSLIFFRILQAIPGGILPVVCMSMLYAIVPREKIGSAMGIYGLGIIVGPAIGPTLGGYLVEYVDWRLIFYINVPIGVVGALAGVALLPKMMPTSTRRLDVWGFLTIGSGLFAMLLATSKGTDWGWGSYAVVGLLVYSGFALALFVVIEFELDEPLLDLRVFLVWPFVNSLLLISVLSIGLNAILFYLPLFMQEGQGIQALQTGLTLLPEALMMAVLMPVAGTLYDKIGPRWPAVIGLLIAAYGGYLLCGINPSMTQQDVVIWTCIRAAGNGLAMMPIMTAGLAAIPAAFASSGSPVNNIAQRVSGSLGLAGLTVLATSQQAQLMADRAALIPATSGVAPVQQIVAQGQGMIYAYYQQLSLYVMADAYSNVFLVCCVLTAAAVVLALFLHSGSPAAETAAAPEPAAVPAAGAPAAAPATVATPAGGAALVTDAMLEPAAIESLPEPPREPAVPHHRGAESGDPHADPRVTVGAAYRRD
ncbi:MAG TPA: MDR family MFS transporter [Pseudonocardia sp.]|jgi:EmrB/QacA subfamily drug resistance transporter|nr:MDR family MFS transporter [Pseudonocardia sp.]